MDLKIMSGVLITRAHRKGTVVIDFSSNEIVPGEGDLEPEDLRRERMIAPRGMENWYFDGKPCHTVSLREITVQDEDEHTLWAKPSTIEWDEFIIDSSVDEVRMRINWNAGGGGRTLIEEISYLVIGQVAEPPEGPD